MAVSRGCRHYAPMVEGYAVSPELSALTHEVLGCALLRLSMPAGFDAFRCGAMVLSDFSNRPEVIGDAAVYLGVESRVGYLVRVALVHDNAPEFWKRLESMFPNSDDCGLLPGPSRLISETRISSDRRGPIKVWLRTHYRP